MRRIVVAGLVALVAWGLTSPAWAEAGDKRIRFGVLYSNPLDDFSSEGQTTELDGAAGFQASFEWNITDLIGLEPAISSATHDVEIEETGFPDIEFGEIDWFAVTANVNFHFLRESRVDLKVGPTIGYVFWGDLEPDPDQGPEDLKTDEEFVYGINLGLDVPFGESKWGFSGAVNYLFAEIGLEEDSNDLGVDPIQLKVGVSYSF